MKTHLRESRPAYIAAFLVGTALSALPSSAVAALAVNDIGRYCTACWQNARLQPDCWPDCTQEVFVRLLERVSPSKWSQILANDTEERREFVRAIDAVKKRTQRAHRPASLADDVADRSEPKRRQMAEQRQIVMEAAREHLPPRQSHILELSFDGWSVHEIADDMGLPPARVSDEKYKAIQKLRRVV